ncbi:MAG: response regulator [Polyangiaceae bacterium]|nr:response regulator [Polyangiaceae bacterium]
MAKTILLVDDSRTHRSLLRVFLTGHDFEFVEAANGVEALDIVMRQRVDLAIVDLHMPELDGVGLLKRLRASARKDVRNLKVVLLTGEKEQASLAEALKAGANELLRKPVSSAGTLNVVLRLLGPEGAPKA